MNSKTNINLNIIEEINKDESQIPASENEEIDDNEIEDTEDLEEVEDEDEGDEEVKN